MAKSNCLDQPAFFCYLRILSFQEPALQFLINNLNVIEKVQKNLFSKQFSKIALMILR